MRTVLLAALLLFPVVSPAQSAGRLKIAFIIPLSGPMSEFGAAIRNGAALAAETDPRVSEAFTALFEDSRYEPKSALAAYLKVTKADKVNAVYLFGGPMADTIAPLAEESGFPLFSTEYDPHYSRGRKYVIRFANNASDFAEVLWEELRARGLKKLAIIKNESQYYNTLVDSLLQVAGSGGGRASVMMNYQLGEGDFRSLIPRLRREGGRTFNALGVYLIPGTQRAFFQQLEAQGLRFSVFGTDTFESAEENAGVESVVEGALYAHPATKPEFVELYTKRFGSAAQITAAALAYEFTMLAAEVLRTQPRSSHELVDRFEIAQPRDGVCGRYIFRRTEAEGGHFSFPVAIKEVRRGNPVILSVREAK